MQLNAGSGGFLAIRSLDSGTDHWSLQFIFKALGSRKHYLLLTTHQSGFKRQ